MQLVWRPLALSDREAIMEYIAEDNPVAAIELDERFEEEADKALQNPTLYKISHRYSRTREIVVSKSYVMVYRVDEAGKVLEILRVLHTSRKWP